MHTRGTHQAGAVVGSGKEGKGLRREAWGPWEKGKMGSKGGGQ